jgi:formylglycine-generating enzyme required for sulfatase activity
VNFYAVSIAGVLPSRIMTWFQALAAARNAGKRLPTNAEWQAAALGTPDSMPCVVTAPTPNPGPTGTVGCVSNVGAFDMVGNLAEWVTDWVPLSTICPGWTTFGGFSTTDQMCLAGASTVDGPAALLRGGDFLTGSGGGVFAVFATRQPQAGGVAIGFRGAR